MTERPVCDSCGRPLPHEESDEPVRKRSVVSIAEPKGEEGTLVPMMEQLAGEYATAGHEQVKLPGEKGWKYGVIHFALFSILTAPPKVKQLLLPKETGG